MGPAWLRRAFPAFDWLANYQRDALAGDSIAGLVVAIMLVPQAMAYAMLAGLPPQVGLYASIVPLVIYGLLGSSRALAVGPVAIVSLMVAATLGELTEAGSADYAAYALVLALMSGAMLFALGLLRLGFIVNFLSHPVISGFTSAAALIIAFSQLKHLLGLPIPRSHLITDTITAVAQRVSDINIATLVLASAAIALLIASRAPLGKLLAALGTPPWLITPATKAGPLIVVALGTLAVSMGSLAIDFGVAVVGDIPRGLPSFTVPRLDGLPWADLARAAALISLVGFLESVSVAKSLAARRRQKIDANQELIALGTANVGAAFTGGYPVTGGFSRSMVNFTAGATSGLASLITAGLVALTVLALTPLFHDLPRAVLSAIIVVAVVSLIDVRGFVHAWRYSRADGLAQAVTFFAVLGLGVEAGILVGVGLSLALHLWRTSRPHIAVVGRVGESEHFRNILRHEVRTSPRVLAVRVDESLYFANASYLQDQLAGLVADRPETEHVVLICSAVNEIDASALDSLKILLADLAASGVTLHLAEVKGPVMDRLYGTSFLKDLTPGRIFLSTHDAMRALANI